MRQTLVRENFNFVSIKWILTVTMHAKNKQNITALKKYIAFLTELFPEKIDLLVSQSFERETGKTIVEFSSILTQR